MTLNLFFLLSLLIWGQAFASFPPTTSKVVGDSTNITTFNYQFPNFTGTHTGTTLSLGVNSVVGGGTGLATLTANNVILGNGTSAPAFVAPSTSGNVLTSNGTTWTSAANASAAYSFIGAAYQDQAANCTPSRTSATLGAFVADTDCIAPTIITNPGVGTIQTTDADLPSFTVNGLAAGTYKVIMTGVLGAGGTTSIQAAINDGTTTTGNMGMRADLGSGDNQFPVVIIAYFVYGSSGNKTFQMFVSSAAAGTESVTLKNNVAGFRVNFSIERIL